MKVFFSICLLWIASHSVFAEPAIRHFNADSYEKILSQYQQQAFVVVLWSLDCPPCYKELELLGRELQQQAFNLVLISTDGIESLDEVAALLNRYGLQHSDNWLFIETSSAQLRYQIDPLWYGELPRSYLYNSNHQRVAVSGVISTSQLSKYK